MKKIKHFLTKYRHGILLFCAFALILFLPSEIAARLGGGGGDLGDSGDSGGDIFSLVFYIFMFIPFPYNLIIIAILFVLFYYFRKKSKQRSILNKLPTGAAPIQARGFDNFIENNPAFSEGKFQFDVETAFVQLQKAWENKNMTKVRKFISDGMYQRLNTQFKMMELLKQTNKLDNVDIKIVYIDKIESDGLYDIIHTAVHASVTDKFVSELYPSLNSGGQEEFVEYWSFIKKRGSQDKDLFNTYSCPACGADLPKDAGEVCKCQSCGVITNSPEYGWVLSEITQADDYITASPLAAKTSNLPDKIAEMVHDHKDFSVQLIEDKASNGYLQIETARVLKEPQIMRRFVTDQAFEKLTNIINSEPQFIYARLYLNDVTLIGVGQKDNLNLLIISVKSSYQRVVAKEKKIEVLDTVVTSKTEVVLMCRAINAGDSKGNIYQHVCSGCGGSVQDTLDIKCPYCGNELNSPKNEWIIADVMSLQQYYEYFGANAAFFYSPVKPEKIDMLYNVRDYAFNNVLIMIAVDGSFADEEIDFAEHLAKKWGYSLDKIQPMIQMAKNNKLVLRMPEDPKMRRKIYALMQKAASVDKNISHQEQSLLDNIKEKYIQ